MAKKAVFLDRDGTLNEDPGYISKPDQLHLFDGVSAALKRLQDAGFFLVIVTNQSGIRRGLIQPHELPLVHARLDELLVASGTRPIDHYEICIHRPEENCDCRKPQPALILWAAKSQDIDLKKSFMVGDKMSDLKAGKAAGVHGVGLVRTGCGLETESLLQGEADFIGDSLLEVADWILSSKI